MSNIRSIINNDLCSGCGVCAGICPSDALTMCIRKDGDLTPHINEQLCLSKCHLCLDICPFAKGYYNPRSKNIELFGNLPDMQFADDIGWYYKCFVGFRQSDSLRWNSASGGLTTWCLEYLIKKGLISSVAVVRFSPNYKNGYFEFCEVSSIDEIRKSAGSVYQPVEISGIIRAITRDKYKRWAIVGVPCLCAAIRNLTFAEDRIPYLLSLACGMYQNIYYTELLLKKSCGNYKNIIKIEYKRKSELSSPSNYRFRGINDYGPGKEIEYHGLPLFLGKYAFFRLNSCNFCMDVFGETADICLMDAWLPEYQNEPKGTSLVVVRKSEIYNLFLKGMADKEISITEVEPQKIIQSQIGHVRRKRILIYMRRGIQLPTSTESKPISVADRIIWWLQRRVQKRSKNMWRIFGRKYGILAFWFMHVDLLIFIIIFEFYFKATSLFKRLCNLIKNLLH